ncbi:hypothetical protein CDS [Bradyrhizobium sp.]|nr:hypothetical protein CDS [Bradyrhizobium sp.]
MPIWIEADLMQVNQGWPQGAYKIYSLWWLDTGLARNLAIDPEDRT